MKQKDLFQYYAADVRGQLDDGTNPRELIEVLAAVSVDLALQVAPTPEYALLAVLDGLRDMTLVHAKRDEDVGHEAQDDGNESEASEETMDAAIFPNTTIH